MVQPGEAFDHDPFDEGGVPHDLDFPIKEYSDVLRQDLGSFIGEWVERYDIDSYNANRLLALTGLTSVVSASQMQRLADVAGEGGEPVPGRILAPSLRVRDDFRDFMTVMAQTEASAPWTRYELFCVEQVGPAAGAVLLRADYDESFPLHTAAKDRSYMGFHPKSPRLFSVEDYRALQKPRESRRNVGQGSALRQAILFSHFDHGIDDNTPRHVLRHFSLHLAGVYPRR